MDIHFYSQVLYGCSFHSQVIYGYPLYSQVLMDANYIAESLMAINTHFKTKPPVNNHSTATPYVADGGNHRGMETMLWKKQHMCVAMTATLSIHLFFLSREW